ncbi:MAG: glycosyltransferase family 2 protein [Planctomyces sp.]|nr:glycosyltransferase family 2 protein [Planctomyces sp.]
MSSVVPRISVVMPAWNASAFVGRAVASVWAQTSPVEELIVVDDGSTDDTAAAALAADARTTIVRQSNGGPGAARNRGVREARGDWLAFLDADDAWRPEKLARQRPACREGVDVVFSYVVDPLPEYTPPAVIDFDALWRDNCVGMSTALVRRTTFEKIGGFDEDREILGVEDYNLWLRMAARGARFEFVPEQLVEYTPAPGNLSSQFGKIARCSARNAEKVARDIGMPEARLQAKLAAIFEEYGVALLHARDLHAARKCLWEALRHQRDRRTVARWLTTFAPRRVLDWRRSLIRSASRFLS